MLLANTAIKIKTYTHAKKRSEWKMHRCCHKNNKAREHLRGLRSEFPTNGRYTGKKTELNLKIKEKHKPLINRYSFSFFFFRQREMGRGLQGGESNFPQEGEYSGRQPTRLLRFPTNIVS